MRRGQVAGKLLILVVLVCFAGSLTWARERRATPDEARDMAERAAVLIARAGPQQAFQEFSRAEGPFRDRELFVVVMDRTGTVLAHGERPQYVGTSMAELRDVQGVPFVAEMLRIPDAGFVEYVWQNPLTQALERKKSYVVHTGAFVVFVGAYIPSD